MLNRCRYGAFIGGPVDSGSRLDWLSRQVPERWGEDFWAQFYEQLAAVFREMGHDDDARGPDRERTTAAPRSARAGEWPDLAVAVGREGWDAGDHRPLRAPAAGRFPLAGLVLATRGRRVQHCRTARGAEAEQSRRSAVARMDDVFSRADGAPLDASTDSLVAGRAGPGQRSSCFHDQPEAASYPEFNAWMYSLDTLLPVLEIGQIQYWRPDPSQPFGPFTLNYYYFQTIIGWAFSLLAVAGFSGLVKSK